MTVKHPLTLKALSLGAHHLSELPTGPVISEEK